MISVQVGNSGICMELLLRENERQMAECYNSL